MRAAVLRHLTADERAAINRHPFDNRTEYRLVAPESNEVLAIGRGTDPDAALDGLIGFVAKTTGVAPRRTGPREAELPGGTRLVLVGE